MSAAALERERPAPDMVQTGQAGAAGKGPVAPQRKSRIELLLDCEAAMRETGSVDELSFLLVNEWRQIVAAPQLFLLERGVGGKIIVSHASDVLKPDPRAPLCRNLAARLTAHVKSGAPDTSTVFSLENLDAGGKPYPFGFAWLNRLSHPKADCARWLVTAFATNPADADRIILDRLAATASHAFALNAMTTQAKFLPRIPRSVSLLSVALLVPVIAFLPVPMTVLAPVEIVASAPQIAAAPMDGVIKSIEVEPNSPVAPGDILFRMNDSELLSALDIAAKNADVAQARWRRAQQGASLSPDLRREAGLAEAEFAAAAAERDAAQSRLDRSLVRAQAGGTAMFNNKDEWTGKPVSTGERIIEIADPARIEARIELGLADSVVLEKPDRITLFMDANPLSPVAATFETAAYQATPTRNNMLAFMVRAHPQANERHRLRIGQRGTAQIRSARVSLAYFLLRRPLSAMRQRFGI